MQAHVHLKPSWQQPPGSWLSVQLPGTEQPTELGPLQGLEAGMVYRQSGSVYRTGLAVCVERSGGPPPFCSSCGPAGHAAGACEAHVRHKTQNPGACTGALEGPRGSAITFAAAARPSAAAAAGLHHALGHCQCAMLQGFRVCTTVKEALLHWLP